FRFYQDLIDLRRRSATIQDGSFKLIAESNSKIFAYERELNGEQIYVFGNFSDDVVQIESPYGLDSTAVTLMTNTDMPLKISDQIELAPFQAFALSCG
ncbi:MAG: oligo-1,6-glucosidase, partial [Yoonia sp.]